MKEFGILLEYFVKCRDLRDSIIGIYRVVFYWIMRKKLDFIWKIFIFSIFSNNNYLMVDFWLYKVESNERGIKM